MGEPTSKHTNTEFNRGQRLEAKLRDAFAQVRSFHLSFDQLLNKLADIRATDDYKRATRYYIGRFEGIKQTLWDALYQYHLEWRVCYGGKLIQSKEVPEGQWSQVLSDSGAHVWRDKPEAIFHGSEEVK